MFDYEGSARYAVLENTQLTYLSLDDAMQTAEALLTRLGLQGYACSHALDMSAARIHAMGDAYNRYWHEGEAVSNAPRMDYSTVTADDEGYYLVYTLMGMQNDIRRDNEAVLFIDRSGVAYMTLRSSFSLGEVLYTPDTLISADQAIELLSAEAAASMQHLPVLSVEKAVLTYVTVRADAKADGMVFTPVWQIYYKDAECVDPDDFSWCEINAVNGKLIDAIFR